VSVPHTFGNKTRFLNLSQGVEIVGEGRNWIGTVGASDSKAQQWFDSEVEPQEVAIDLFIVPYKRID
jgi:hypothetical protein